MFNHPKPNELFTRRPPVLDSGTGWYPFDPDVSRQFVVNLTFSWSGKLEVTWNNQCISKIPLLRLDQDEESMSTQSSGSFGDGNISPSCHSKVGALEAGDAMNPRVADWM